MNRAASGAADTWSRFAGPACSLAEQSIAIIAASRPRRSWRLDQDSRHQASAISASEGHDRASGRLSAQLGAIGQSAGRSGDPRPDGEL